MSDSKKPTISEIHSLMLSPRPLGHKEGVNAIHYLLDLVAKMGKVIDAVIVWKGDQPCYRTGGGVPQGMPRSIERIVKYHRTVLQELKQ